MTQLQNQFSQAPVKGQLDLRFNGQTITGQIDSSESGELVPGQPVKLVDSAGGIPKVIACTADSDEVFGFINYSIKDQKFVALDAVEISVFRNNVMYMEASAAIARGASVMPVITGSKVATAAGGGRIVGTALDKAAADGDLIRVVIDLPGATA